MTSVQFRFVEVGRRKFYRTVGFDWADTILETGPSFNGGGRFNSPGLFGALYFSENQNIAFREWLRERKEEEAEPHVTFAFEVTLGQVVDLKAGQDFDIVEWRSGGYLKPQEIAAQAYHAGAEGILYYSAKTQEEVENLVIFPANVLKSDAIKILHKIHSHR